MQFTAGTAQIPAQRLEPWKPPPRWWTCTGPDCEDVTWHGDPICWCCGAGTHVTFGARPLVHNLWLPLRRPDWSNHA